jgi:hypothetical protein
MKEKKALKRMKSLKSIKVELYHFKIKLQLQGHSNFKFLKGILTFYPARSQVLTPSLLFFGTVAIPISKWRNAERSRKPCNSDFIPDTSPYSNFIAHDYSLLIFL